MYYSYEYVSLVHYIKDGSGVARIFVGGTFNQKLLNIDF